MTGMLYATGNWESYLLRLDKESCEMMDEISATVMVVLLSPALLNSNPCLDELYQALENKMDFIVIRCDDDIPPKKNWWPLSDKKKRDIKQRDAFMLKRKKVVDFLVQQNTIPPPGETILTAPSAPGVFLKELRSALSR